MRPHRGLRSIALAALRVVGTTLSMWIPVAADAQLRPLEPIPWRAFTERQPFSAQVGAAFLHEQRASLAGTSGDLWEVGTFSLAWRTGRVVLEAAGTAQRFFRERERFSEPHPDVREVSSDRRHDSGDYRISTSLSLTSNESPFRAALRFGTRLPTTDNGTGLDRDAIDFFATVGAHMPLGELVLSAEGGIGIHSTREPTFEQDDLFLYAVSAELRRFGFTPFATILGQVHGTSHRELRGLEDLGELRVGVRAGEEVWIAVEAVRGYETFSPSSGIIVSIGARR